MSIYIYILEETIDNNKFAELKFLNDEKYFISNAFNENYFIFYQGEYLNCFILTIFVTYI